VSSSTHNAQREGARRAGEPVGACERLACVHPKFPAVPMLGGRLTGGGRSAPVLFLFTPGNLPSLTAGGRNRSGRCAFGRQTGPRGRARTRRSAPAIVHTRRLNSWLGVAFHRSRLSLNVHSQTAKRVGQDIRKQSHPSNPLRDRLSNEANQTPRGFPIARKAFPRTGNVFC
jgi:hypothetical protein